MNLNKESRVVRLYRWSLDMVNEFLHGEYPTKYKSGTNLCHFVRVICLYMPAIFVLNAVLYSAVVAAVVALPIYFYGFTSWTWVVGTIAFVVLAIVGLRYWRDRRRDAKRIQVEPAYDETRKENDGPGVREVAREWFRARKQKICPQVSFYEPKEAS